MRCSDLQEQWYLQLVFVHPHFITCIIVAGGSRRISCWDWLVDFPTPSTHTPLLVVDVIAILISHSKYPQSARHHQFCWETPQVSVLASQCRSNLTHKGPKLHQNTHSSTNKLSYCWETARQLRIKICQMGPSGMPYWNRTLNRIGHLGSFKVILKQQNRPFL